MFDILWYQLRPTSPQASRLLITLREQHEWVSTQLSWKAITNGSELLPKMKLFILHALEHHNKPGFQLFLNISISLTLSNFKHLCFRHCVKCWGYKDEVDGASPLSKCTNWWRMWRGNWMRSVYTYVDKMCARPSQVYTYIHRRIRHVLGQANSKYRRNNYKDFLKRVTSGRGPQKD